MEFENKLRSRQDKESAGDYEKVTKDGVTLSVGDLIVWSDPDVGMHVGECELVNSAEWVVEVTKLWKKWNAYDEEWELKIGNTGVGWIDWDSVAIPGEKGNSIIIPETAKGLVEQFKESEYEKYMYWQYHMGRGGTPEGLWEVYEEQEYGNSGPHCEYCMSDDKVRIDGN